MKKIVQLNIVCNGSTGKIMDEISKKSLKEGYSSYCFYGRGKPGKNGIYKKFGNKFSVYLHVMITRLFNNHGHGSYFSTKKLVKQIKKINPDIIHLHNIHGYWINIGVLFKYLKEEYKGKIIWTLHDCWAFTGHCSYFTMVGCDKWKNQCYKCIQKKSYPKSFIFDTSKKEYIYKKKMFSNLNNLTIVTPSKWLANIVKLSFLNNYKIKVIDNGIDLDVFKPTIDKKILKKYNIPNDKKIILGIANIWEERKGLNTFLELSKIISNNEIIVLVGLTEKQINKLPKNIIGIKRTDNIDDLVKIYSVSSVFLNPSLEETFSLVTVEAMACGLPVVVSKTSAVKDLVIKGVGDIVDEETPKDYYKKMKNLKYTKKEILNHVKKYSLLNNVNNYFELYKEN